MPCRVVIQPPIELAMQQSHVNSDVDKGKNIKQSFASFPISMTAA